MQELEGKAMEALSASVNKCQLTESQLDGERLRTQQLEEQVEVLERHLARFLGGDMPALD